MIKVVRELNEHQVLVVQDDEDYFLVSESVEYIQPVEVLVFPAYSDGRVASWLEVDGEVGSTLDQFLPRLLDKGCVSAPWEDDLPF